MSFSEILNNPLIFNKKKTIKYLESISKLKFLLRQTISWGRDQSKRNWVDSLDQGFENLRKIEER